MGKLSTYTALALAIRLLFAPMQILETAQAAPELVVQPGLPPVVPLSDRDQKQINGAIERGVAYLRRAQLPIGLFWVNTAARPTPVSLKRSVEVHGIGRTALCGLALLECETPVRDDGVQLAARFLRAYLPAHTRTYNIALGILFFDQLNVPEDRPLLRKLALRLASGQTNLGGWTYHCPVLTAAQEEKVLRLLRQWKGKENMRDLSPAGLKAMANIKDKADNSNTQFAILALLAARRNEVPVDYTLAKAEQRFRASQQSNGWGYGFRSSTCYGSMTCAGLLGLAVGHAPAADVGKQDAAEMLPNLKGKAFPKGLRALAAHMKNPRDPSWRKGTLYYLWSVERVAVLCNLRTIGGKDWYRWGAELIVPGQRVDGSWNGTVNTCFALLFLKKSDLLPDLRKTLKKNLDITDPVLDDLKKAIAKKNGGKLPDREALAKQENLSLKLAILKANQVFTKKIRVRSFLPFRILEIRGSDKQLGVDLDNSEPHKVHEMTLTVRPAKPGDFRRTIYLKTDIPGRAEVPVRIEAKVVAE